MRKKFLFVLIMLIGLGVRAQHFNKCSLFYNDSIAVTNNPEILKVREELEIFTQNYIRSKNKNYEKIIIPVVFHVLHQYGNERITIEQIQRGIDQMNIDFRAENIELNNVVSAFVPIIGNPVIEFRLAKLDPDGNCTTGVEYYDTELTFKASNSLKYTVKSWDPQSYLNIWTVSSIESGAAAWSHYPGIDSELDGVVSIYTYVQSSHVLSHEVGHYLNLIHPWGSTNEPGLESNCNIDDLVEDTPNTIGVDQHCKLGQVSCGSLDNVQNFMDYSTCEAMFTQGQVDRMRAALNSNVSGRENLWTEENLRQTGTNDDYIDPGCLPVADIESEIHPICPGTSYQFTDFSYGSEISQRQWIFEGGDPNSSSVIDPIVSYTIPGLYPVSLTVSNNKGKSTITRPDLVFVPDTLAGYSAPILIDMEDVGFPTYSNDIFKKWTFKEGGNAHWEKFTNGNTSLRIRNFANSVGDVNAFTTSNIDLSKVNNPDYIYFDIAYAQKSNESFDELKVYISPDCGKKWIIKYVKSGKSLVTNGGTYLSSNFVPTANQWRTEKIDIRNYAKNNFLWIKFEVTSKGGNYLYVDNINVAVTPNAIDQNRQLAWVSIYPNPIKEELAVNYYLEKDQLVSFQLINLLGEQVFQFSELSQEGSNQKIVNLKQLGLKKGLYILYCSNQQSTHIERIIISE